MSSAFRVLLNLLKRYGAAIGTWIAANGVSVAAAVGIRAAVVAAWATFLAVFWTGLTSLAIRDILAANPLSGAPAGVLYLVDSVFPLQFFFGLSIGYIVFKLTVMRAAEIMSRTIKFLFGG